MAGLVWSPGAAPALVSLIDSAHRTLTVENEAMASTPVISALKAAGRRGVLVKVVMTDSPAWHSVWTGLTRAGVEVATYPNTPGSLDIHAKAMVADDLTAFVGSQIFSKASLSYSRELGLTTSDAAVVAPLSQTLDADFAGGTRFRLKHPTIARGTGHTTTTTRAVPATTTTTRAA